MIARERLLLLSWFGAAAATLAAVASDCPMKIAEVDTLTESMTPDVYATEYAPEGDPLVLRHACQSWPALQKWSLSSLKQQFGEQVCNRKIEIDEPIFGENGEYIGRFDGNDEIVDTAGSLDHISWLVLNESVSQILRQSYSTFGLLSERNTYQGPEYFFIGQAVGQGREPHIDYDCASTWSAQIVGRKRWRLWKPNDGVLGREAHQEFVGDLEQTSCFFEVVLEPGDVLVWHAGWTHATVSLDHESVALSKQFSSPVPNAMFRKYSSYFEDHHSLFDSFGGCVKDSCEEEGSCSRSSDTI